MKKQESKPVKAAEEKKAQSYTVKSPFTDKYDNTVHKVGDDVSSFDAARLADLVSRGLVKKS